MSDTNALAEKLKSVKSEELDTLRRIADLEEKLVHAPKNVGMLTTLMHCYWDLGLKAKGREIAIRLREIPSDADLRVAARGFLETVSRIDPNDTAEIEKLRVAYSDLFAILEGRTQIRPAVVMEALSCSCTFAVDILRGLHRLGLVSSDEGLGLRRVFLHALSCGDQRAAEADRQQERDWRIRDMSQVVSWLGGNEIKDLGIFTLMRHFGWGYNHAALVGDRLAERGILRRSSDQGMNWIVDRKALMKKGGGGMKRLHGILCVAAVAIGLAYAAVHWPVVFFAASVAMAYAAARRYWPPVEILAGAVVALAVVLGGVLLSSERRERLRELVDCEQDVPTVLDGRSDE